MMAVSFRLLVGSLVVVLAAAGPLAAQEATLDGIWTLDLKASRNVPEAQKGVDLKIAVHDDQLTIARFAGQVAIGEPMLLTLDGKSRPLDVGGQKATMTSKWLKRPTKFELVISMPQPGSVFIAVQSVVTEVSPTGGTLTRTYETRRAKELEYRLLVYRRK
jgi:hypothetical protein